MKTLNHCPYCQGDFTINRVTCQQCTTAIDGEFSTNRFHRFNDEELLFIEYFLKNEGSIKMMEKDLGVSYPTVKARLKHIIQTLGYDTKDQQTTRLDILNQLSEGKLSVKQAMKKIEELS